MRQHRILGLLLAVVCCLVLGESAQARGRIPLWFGDYEEISHIADTQIPVPDASGEAGAKLELGVRFVRKAFILPYTVSVDGLVLYSGKRYMKMPEGEDLKGLQDQGLLPNPLPEASLGFLSYLWSYALEVLIFGFLALIVIGHFKSPATDPAGSPQSGES